MATVKKIEASDAAKDLEKNVAITKEAEVPEKNVAATEEPETVEKNEAGGKNVATTNEAEVAKKNEAATEEPEVAEKKGAGEKRSSTVDVRNASAEAGRVQKKSYQDWKAFALEREQDNYSKLFMIHEKKQWWKMVGHSAIMFYYEVSNWIHYNCKLHKDSDFENQSEEGIVNIRDVYKLDKKLAAFNIELLKATKEYRVYNLGKKFTPGDLEHMKKERDLEWAKVNKVILPKEVFPSLFLLERDLYKNVFHAGQKMPAYVQNRTMNPVTDKVAELLREYSFLASENGLSDIGYLDKVKEVMTWCMAQMVLVSELRLLPPEKIFQILSLMGKVKREVEVCRPKRVEQNARLFD